MSHQGTMSILFTNSLSPINILLSVPITVRKIMFEFPCFAFQSSFGTINRGYGGRFFHFLGYSRPNVSLWDITTNLINFRTFHNTRLCSISNNEDDLIPDNSYSDSCSQSLTKVFEEYLQLSSLNCLTSEQEERLAMILEQAETNDELAFLLSEGDQIIGDRCGLLDNENLDYYNDQFAWLQEEIIPDKSDGNQNADFYHDADRVNKSYRHS